MRKTRKSRRDDGIAWLIVVLLHGGLMRVVIDQSSRSEIAADDAALQVILIEAPPVTRPVPSPPPHGTVLRTASTPSTSQPARANAHATVAPADATTPESRPLSAVFIAQGQQWAKQQALAETAAQPRDPFADRAATLPGRPSGAFRMRAPVSVASVVEKVGALFYGSHERDPCPRVTRNIVGLATAGDTAALQQDIEFERRHCRP